MSHESIQDRLESAEINKQVDLLDTLKRIASEWSAIRKPCNCKANEACSACEIDFLIEEAFGITL